LKVVRLLPKDASYYSDIIQLLEGIIEEARAGEVYAIGLVMLYEKNTDVATAFTNGAYHNAHRFLGAIEVLRHRAMRDLIEVK
jgi:hypothetical protein